jgi:cellulose synthase/poly-beta-1,6-N-acetylglucosamine synthase-like glycosyltransferase
MDGSGSYSVERFSGVIGIGSNEHDIADVHDSRLDHVRYQQRKRTASLESALLYSLPLIAIIAMLTAAIFAFRHLTNVLIAGVTHSDYVRIVEAASLLSLFVLLIAFNLAYFITIFGFERKRDKNRTVTGATLEAVHEETGCKSLLLLVPSYKEERDVVFQTMMSAALVEYPGRTVVLLIDDPPLCANSSDAARLEVARRLPMDLGALFDPIAERFDSERIAFELRKSRVLDRQREAVRLANLFGEAAAWLEQRATEHENHTVGSSSHTDRLFRERILLQPAQAHRLRAAELRKDVPEPDRVARDYARLAALFRVRFDSFERKKYINLSHAPNKAMNLNSYLGLLGQNCREVLRSDGLHIAPVGDGEATLSMPDPEFIVSVDADSLVTSDYALRLVAVMRAPGNERIGVAQCPYTAIPGAAGMLERTASASTDVQFFSHHGMDYFQSSFWVGAAALMRRTALEDIATTRLERGYAVKVFIHDRILIEDAAATVDLIGKGWRVYHDLARLSYSATPADFGALIIQRRRWANGGLLILPKLVRHVFKSQRKTQSVGQSLLRLPTLLSAAIPCFYPILLFPFDDELITSWMLAASAPYYFVYGRDLLRAGYGWRDLPRVYALNWLLVPVQIGGTIQSLRQAWSGDPLPFQRTPKIGRRTVVLPAYILAPCGAVIVIASVLAYDLWVGNYWHLFFNFFNGGMLAYAIFRFIGIRPAWVDIRAIVGRRKMLNATLAPEASNL